MIYYRYTVSYQDYKGSAATLIVTRAAEDLLYQSHLEETKIIARQSIRENNNGVLPASMNETTTTLTLTQYNAAVKGPDDLEVIESIEPQVGE